MKVICVKEIHFCLKVFMFAVGHENTTIHACMCINSEDAERMAATVLDELIRDLKNKYISQRSRIIKIVAVEI